MTNYIMYLVLTKQHTLGKKEILLYDISYTLLAIFTSLCTSQVEIEGEIKVRPLWIK